MQIVFFFFFVIPLSTSFLNEYQIFMPAMKQGFATQGGLLSETFLEANVSC